MKDIKTLLNNELSLLEGIKAMPSLALNLSSLYFNRKKYKGPTFLSWSLTNECQCSCKHCNGRQDDGMLSSCERLEIAKDIAVLPTYWISLIGGEPLLVPEILDIIRILKKHNKKVTITTNGVILTKFMRDLIDIRIDAIHISVDSHKSKVHDYLRNSPGLFLSIHDFIKEFRKHNKKQRTKVKLRCTISKKNYLEMKEYVEFWKDKVDSIHFQPIVDNNINQARDKNLLFSKEDEPSFRNAILQLQNEYTNFKNLYYSLMPEYLFNRHIFFDKLNYKCLFVPSCGLFILPNGSVTVCYGRRKNVLGNALSENIQKIWMKRETLAFHREILDTPQDYFYSQCFCWDPSTIFNLYLVVLDNFIKKFWKNGF